MKFTATGIVRDLHPIPFSFGFETETVYGYKGKLFIQYNYRK